MKEIMSFPKATQRGAVIRLRASAFIFWAFVDCFSLLGQTSSFLFKILHNVLLLAVTAHSQIIFTTKIVLRDLKECLCCLITLDICEMYFENCTKAT